MDATNIKSNDIKPLEKMLGTVMTIWLIYSVWTILLRKAARKAGKRIADELLAVGVAYHACAPLVV
jgi:hypothetical protein